MKLHKKKSLKSIGLSFLGAIALALTFIGSSQAATSASIDIHVSISATKSLSIGTTHYNFGALSVNTSSVSATPVVVTNNSGALQETYTMQGADATGSGTTWTLASSTGTLDEYVLAGQFSTASPANDDASWNSDEMTTSAVACSATQFGNGTANQSGLSVSPISGSNTRNLWFRMITPLYVSDVSQRNATLTLAVQ